MGIKMESWLYIDSKGHELTDNFHNLTNRLTHYMNILVSDQTSSQPITKLSPQGAVGLLGHITPDNCCDKTTVVTSSGLRS